MRTPSLAVFLFLLVCHNVSAQVLNHIPQNYGPNRICDLDGGFLEPIEISGDLFRSSDRANHVVYVLGKDAQNQTELRKHDLVQGTIGVVFDSFTYEINECAVDEAAGFAFTNYLNGFYYNTGLVQHNLATGTYQILPAQTNRIRSLAVDPVNQTVYYMAQNYYTVELWSCDYSGGNQTLLQTFSNSTTSWPNVKYIPESQQLVISITGPGSPAVLDLVGNVVSQSSIVANPGRTIFAVDYDPYSELIYWIEAKTYETRYIYRQSATGGGTRELVAALPWEGSSSQKKRLFIFPDFDGDELGTLREAQWGSFDNDLDSDDDGLSDSFEYLETRRHDWFEALSGNETHYYSFSEEQDFFLAVEEAQSLGGYLASIGDSTENQAVYDEIHGPFYGDVFMGLSRPQANTPWEWDSGEPLSFWNNPQQETPQDRFIQWNTSNGLSPSWYYTDSPVGPSVIESPWNPILSPGNPDSDGDGVQDGTELGVTSPIPDQLSLGIFGTDTQVFQPDADPLTTTRPLDADSDDDGMTDGEEDLNGNGAFEAGELNPLSMDTDEDLLQDGTESGRAIGHAHTSMRKFQPDVDPNTSTNPLLQDTDGGGLWDGLEDFDHNGAFVFFEFDPLDSGDDRFTLQSPGLVAGQVSTLTLDGFRPGSMLAVVASINGLGVSQPISGLVLDILPPYLRTVPFTSFTTTATVDILVPPGAPSGIPVCLQAVERIYALSAFRTSAVVVETVQ